MPCFTGLAILLKGLLIFTFMAKRFIDTGIFDDDWFMDLSKDAKLLWLYFITKCDHAGILKLNEKLCTVQTDIKDLNKVIKELGNRLVRVNKQLNLFFIPKYIEFQYPGFPNSQVRQQNSAVDILVKYGLFDKENLTLTKELTNSYEHDTDNVIVNEHEKPKKQFIKPTLEEVKNYFTENGYDTDVAKRAFMSYDVANWVDSQGKSIKNWKQKMIQVWFKPENKLKKVIPHTPTVNPDKLTLRADFDPYKIRR